MRGRKPKPTTLHVLHGTFNSTRHADRANEPRPQGKLLKPPEFLDAIAREEWQRVRKELHDLGLLTAVDRSALAAYCVSYSRWVQAEEAIKSQALMVKNGEAIGPNPFIAIANRAMEQMMRAAAEFGMTPSARTRVRTEPKKQGGDDDESRFIAG